MEKKQRNIAIALFVAVLVIAAAALALYLPGHPSQVASTTTVSAATTTITTTIPPAAKASRVLNESEMEGIFGVNGTYNSTTYFNVIILNNQSVNMEKSSMEFNFSKYGQTAAIESIDFPVTNYTGYNLTNNYERSTLNFKRYTQGLPSGINSTSQSGVLYGMTYTLFTQQTNTGQIQLYLIGYKGITSVVMNVNGFATAIKPSTTNAIIGAVAQTI